MNRPALPNWLLATLLAFVLAFLGPYLDAGPDDTQAAIDVAAEVAALEAGEGQ